MHINMSYRKVSMISEVDSDSLRGILKRVESK